MYAPTPVQQEFHSCPAFEVLFGGAAGPGKLFPLDVPIPTPTGWTTMGALAVGDEVFDENGRICRVTFLSDIEESPELYRLTFDDASTIEACKDHQWLTFNASELAALSRKTPEYRADRRAKRPSRASANPKKQGPSQTCKLRNAKSNPALLTEAPKGSIRTTAEIASTLTVGVSGRTNHAISIAGSLDLPNVDLPLDPYLLGLWLGDGTSAGGGFTSIDPELWEAFEAKGFKVTHSKTVSKAHHVCSLVGPLRAAGVLGKKKKRIPDLYLRASYSQRIALLQGLMDTDGTVNLRRGNGYPDFVTTSPALAEGFYDLVCGLGLKCNKRERVAKLYGREISPKWSFIFNTSFPAFRLKRKADLQTPSRRRTSLFRYITGAERIESRPGRCIQVDSPSHLYLAGRQMVPTHNTESLLWDPVPLIQQEHERLRHDKRYHSIGRVLHLRRTFPQLDENIDRFNVILSDTFGTRKGIRYDGDSHTFQLESGLKCQFGHMKDLASWQNYVGQQYVRVYWDELTQFEQSQYLPLLARIRSSDPLLRPWLGSRAATNPEAGWVRDRFVLPAKEGRVMLTEDIKLADGSKTTRTRMFIPAKLSDHPDPEFRRDYEATLALQPAHIRKALTDGDWWVSVGAYYADSWDPKLHVTRPFKIPPTWPRFRSCDWGFASACAILWWAIDPNDTLICYREKILKRHDWTQVVDEIRDCEMADGVWDKRRGHSLLNGPLDTNAWEERGHTGPSIAIGMMSKGVPWRKATKGRRMAAQEMVRRLRHRNKDGSPGILFFDTCKEAVETIPTLKTDPSDLEVPLKGGNDHPYDAASYAINARYTYKSLPPPIAKDDDDERDERESQRSRLYDSRGRLLAS